MKLLSYHILLQVADGIMKIYDTNLSKFDSMALKTCLLFYLFANCEPDKVSTYLKLPSIKIILLFSD